VTVGWICPTGFAWPERANRSRGKDSLRGTQQGRERERAREREREGETSKKPIEDNLLPWGFGTRFGRSSTYNQKKSEYRVANEPLKIVRTLPRDPPGRRD
jgi:hypothetical protein